MGVLAESGNLEAKGSSVGSTLIPGGKNGYHRLVRFHKVTKVIVTNYLNKKFNLNEDQLFILSNNSMFWAFEKDTVLLTKYRCLPVKLYVCGFTLYLIQDEGAL